MKLRVDPMTALVLWCLLAVLVLAAPNADAMSLDLSYSAALVPPHNEPVVGNKVARYQIKAGVDLYGDLWSLKPELTMWGVNTWQSGGSQKTSSWSDDDWTIEEWRPALNMQIDLGPEQLRFFSEFYTPFGGWSRKGAGSFESYWWLVGVRGRLNLF